MSNYKDFPKKLYHSRNENIAYDCSPDGSLLPVRGTNPYIGLHADSFKPTSIIASGGTLKPSPRIANNDMQLNDVVNSQLSNSLTSYNE